MVFHSGNMTSQQSWYFKIIGFDAGNITLLNDFNIGDEVPPVDVEDGVQAAVVEALEEVNVAKVGDPGLSTQKSGDNNAAL